MSARTHIVLIPGFGAFDMLGQIEYYAGITPVYRRWRAHQSAPDRQVVLHYFDNLPTASVATRAQRLRQYLSKRLLRGEFLPHDRIALVGHSTGGLDIRRLVMDLEHMRRAPIAFDGAAGNDAFYEDLLKMIKVMVFVSTPQCGCNIADYIRKYQKLIHAAIPQFSALVDQARGEGLPLIPKSTGAVASGLLNHITRADIFLAITQALDEVRVDQAHTPFAKAEARMNGAEISLWLEQIGGDFSAINDLSAADANPGQGDPLTELPPSPAHYSPAQRLAEIKCWKELNIRTCSYATRGRSFETFKKGQKYDTLSLLSPPLWRSANLLGIPPLSPDIVYRLTYRASAGGPFNFPSPDAFEGGETGIAGAHLDTWTNDGIVNTASMYWPHGPATKLVECDHLDIVGHFTLKPQLGESGEPEEGVYGAFDLLNSRPLQVCNVKGGQADDGQSRKPDPDFSEHTFETVWRQIFEFCVAEPLQAGY